MEGTKRIRWAVIAIAAIGVAGCEGVSTSSYAVAAGFAAVAGAAQIAEAVHANANPTPTPMASPSGSSPSGMAPATPVPSPDPATSSVAVDPASPVPGTSPNVAPSTSWALALSSSPYGNGFSMIVPPATLCRRQLAIICFAGSKATCEIDPRGCEICSCTTRWPGPGQYLR